MTDQNIGIVAADNGTEIINGLNLLAAFATHPHYGEICKLILIPQLAATLDGNTERLKNSVKAALLYINEINKSLGKCEACSIQFGLVVQKINKNPTEKSQ